MESIILEIINQFGYIGVFILITVENIFPPIPSETILIFGGFMTTFSDINVWGVIAAATIGSVLGAIVLYILGRMLHTKRLELLLDSRFGKILHLRGEDIRRAEQWFKKHGNIAVFFCRFIPIARSLISIPAGISKMKCSSFLLLTIFGTFIWNTILIYLGRLGGTVWETIVSYVNLYFIIAYAFFAFILFAMGVNFIKKRLLEKSNS